MLSSSDITDMRETQTESLMDVCHFQTRAVEKNSFGETIESWSDAPADIACGLDTRPGRETRKNNMTVTVYDAVLRLAIDNAPSETQRISIIKRNGENVPPLIYEIVSPVQRGATGNRILLRRVTL